MSEYMCPNCVTPWKCNGPHIPPPSAAPPDAGELVGLLNYLGAFEDVHGDGISAACKRAADWIEQAERDKMALTRTGISMLRENVALESDLADALRQLQVARACIKAADAMRQFVSSGTLTTTNDNKVVTMTNPAADAYDAARAGITLSADSGGEGGV